MLKPIGTTMLVLGAGWVLATAGAEPSLQSASKPAQPELSVAWMCPFEWRDDAKALCRPLCLPDERCVAIQSRAAARAGKSIVQVDTNSRIFPTEHQALRSQNRLQNHRHKTQYKRIGPRRSRAKGY